MAEGDMVGGASLPQRRSKATRPTPGFWDGFVCCASRWGRLFAELNGVAGWKRMTSGRPGWSELESA